MTDKEVRKLKKPELLEILFYLQKEVEALKDENERLTNQLESISNAGLSEADVQRISDAVRAAVGETLKVKVLRTGEKPKE